VKTAVKDISRKKCKQQAGLRYSWRKKEATTQDR